LNVSSERDAFEFRELLETNLILGGNCWRSNTSQLHRKPGGYRTQSKENQQQNCDGDARLNPKDPSQNKAPNSQKQQAITK
jgi:hypothetical protein